MFPTISCSSFERPHKELSHWSCMDVELILCFRQGWVFLCIMSSNVFCFLQPKNWEEEQPECVKSCLTDSLHSRPSSLSRATGALMLLCFSFLIQKWERLLPQSGSSHHLHWLLWLTFVCFCHLYLCKPLPLTSTRGLREQDFIFCKILFNKFNLWNTLTQSLLHIELYLSVEHK